MQVFDKKNIASDNERLYFVINEAHMATEMCLKWRKFEGREKDNSKK